MTTFRTITEDLITYTVFTIAAIPMFIVSAITLAAIIIVAAATAPLAMALILIDKCFKLNKEKPEHSIEAKDDQQTPRVRVKRGKIQKAVSKISALWVWLASGGRGGDGPRISRTTTPAPQGTTHHPASHDTPSENRHPAAIPALILLSTLALASCSTHRWQKSTSNTHFGTAHAENLVDSTWRHSSTSMAGTVTTIQYSAVVLPDGTWTPDTTYHATITRVIYSQEQQHDLATATQTHVESTDSISTCTTTTTETNVQHSTNLKTALKPVIRFLWSLLLIYLLFQIIRFCFRRQQ